MSPVTLEQRLVVVEQELSRLNAERVEREVDRLPWWEQIFGSFANSDAHDEATRHGREYRESLRPTHVE